MSDTVKIKTAVLTSAEAPSVEPLKDRFKLLLVSEDGVRIEFELETLGAAMLAFSTSLVAQTMAQRLDVAKG